jgi:hypothetical protein
MPIEPVEPSMLTYFITFKLLETFSVSIGKMIYNGTHRRATTPFFNLGTG